MSYYEYIDMFVLSKELNNLLKKIDNKHKNDLERIIKLSFEQGYWVGRIVERGDENGKVDRY